MRKYILARLNEVTTWQGIVFIITSLFLNNATPEQAQSYILLGLGLSGLMGAAFPDKLD